MESDFAAGGYDPSGITGLGTNDVMLTQQEFHDSTAESDSPDGEQDFYEGTLLDSAIVNNSLTNLLSESRETADEGANFAPNTDLNCKKYTNTERKFWLEETEERNATSSEPRTRRICARLRWGRGGATKGTIYLGWWIL